MRISDPRLQRQLEEQLSYLLKLTTVRMVIWKRTAHTNETFRTGVSDRFVFTVWEDTRRRYFTLANIEGQIQVIASSADSDLVDKLYSEAKRNAFNLDTATADIIRTRP